MDTKHDSVLFLLQDIKELIFGLALCFLGGILMFASTLDWDADELFLVLSLPVLAWGVFHIWNGWTRHEVIEKREDAQRGGDSHAL